jgi:hypothetical protein
MSPALSPVVKIAGTFRQTAQHTHSTLLVITGEVRIAQGHIDVLMAHQVLDGGESYPPITRRLAKVCRKSSKVKSSRPALQTARSNAV